MYMYVHLIHTQISLSFLCLYFQVNDVATFIRSLPGCDIYVEEFTRQEIDGQALSLLKEDHLMNAMNIKLGPALKICASIKQHQEQGL